MIAVGSYDFPRIDALYSCYTGPEKVPGLTLGTGGRRMNTIKGLIHEIHRRSLWQVLGIFLAASWGVIQVVDVLTEAAGLPDWTPTMALVTLMLGLPICLATAFVQEGLPRHERGDDGGGGASADDAPLPNLAAGTGSLDRPTTRPSTAHRLLTWRNAFLGGVGAFALLGFAVVTYFVMWTTGFGPVGNLVAKGVIAEGERVLLADFADATGEGYADAITEALRIDLVSASVLDLVERSEIAPTLRLMQLEPGAKLTADLAREVAVRAGIPAVIDGEVTSLGSGYILSATLRATDSGRSLAAFRVTANSPDELIRSTDQLSQNLRERSGESLRTIRAGKPLEQVTTSSLEALKLYTEALRLYYERADGLRTAELLEQALSQDSTFAMAWRMLGVALQGGLNPTRRFEAIANAFRYRDRLQDVERYVVEAMYYAIVARDQSRVIEAYQNTLRLDPDEPRALNNLAVLYKRRFDLEPAEQLLRRAVSSPGRNGIHFRNLVDIQVSRGRFDEATAALLEWEERFSDDVLRADFRFRVFLARGDLTAAADQARQRSEDRSVQPNRRAEGTANLGRLAYWTGHLEEARDLFLRAEVLGAQASAAIAWRRRLDTAYEEALVGDSEWARTHIREGLQGTYSTLSPAGRVQLGAALSLASLGYGEAVEFLIRDWTDVTPEEWKGPSDAAMIERASLYAGVAQGDTADAVKTMERLLLEWGCSDTCWPFERARLYDRLGEYEQAAELYERVREPGYHGWGPNTGQRLAAMLRLGPLYEEIGDTAKAVEAYERMADQWADGGPHAQVTVRRFQERIADLGG